MVPNTSDPPVGFSQETSLNCKYIKSIPNLCTNPSVAFGTSTHTHTAGSLHTHTAGSAAHTHSGPTAGATPSSSHVSWQQSGLAPTGHTHQQPSSSTDPSIIVECSSSHTHDTVTNELTHRTVSFYKKTESSISLRRRPIATNMMFYSSTSSVPGNFTHDCLYDCKHLKGISACPGTNAGTNCHTHANATHTHGLDLGAHTHTIISSPATSFSGSFRNTGSTCSWTPRAYTHGHSAGGSLTSSDPCSVTSNADTGHTHGNKSMEVAYKTLLLVSTDTIRIRQSGIPKNILFNWVDNLNLIPAGFQVSDGTNGTTDMLGKYPKGSCTPGNTGGCNAHTHTSEGGCHTHPTTSIPHTHPGSGSTGGECSLSGTQHLGGSPTGAVGSHTHAIATSNSGTLSQTVSGTAGAHTHDNAASEPIGLTVAFIEKV